MPDGRAARADGQRAAHLPGHRHGPRARRPRPRAADHPRRLRVGYLRQEQRCGLIGIYEQAARPGVRAHARARAPRHPPGRARRDHPHPRRGDPARTFRRARVLDGVWRPGRHRRRARTRSRAGPLDGARRDASVGSQLRSPASKRPALRPLRRTALHDRLAERGAVFTQVYGWERPKWFPGAAGLPVADRVGSAASRGSTSWREECRAVRERVGLLELSGSQVRAVRSRRGGGV